MEKLNGSYHSAHAEEAAAMEWWLVHGGQFSVFLFGLAILWLYFYCFPNRRVKAIASKPRKNLFLSPIWSRAKVVSGIVKQNVSY